MISCRGNDKSKIQWPAVEGEERTELSFYFSFFFFGNRKKKHVAKINICTNLDLSINFHEHHLTCNMICLSGRDQFYLPQSLVHECS